MVDKQKVILDPVVSLFLLSFRHFVFELAPVGAPQIAPDEWLLPCFHRHQGNANVIASDDLRP